MIEYFKAGTIDFKGGMLLPKAYEAVIEHERNGKFDLEFKYPISDTKYKEFAKHDIFYADVPYMGKQAFYLSNLKKMNNHVVVYAKHIFFLNGKNVSKDIATAMSRGYTGQLIMDEYARSLQIPHPFTFSSNITERHVFNEPGYSNAMEPLAEGKHSILGQWGGVLVMDNWDVKLQKRWGRDTEFLIAKRKNINDVEINEENDDIVTRLFLTKEVEHEETYLDKFGEEQTRTIKETLEAIVDSPLIDEYSQVFGESRETEDESILTQEDLIKHGKNIFRTQRIDLPKETFTLGVTDDVKDYEFTIDDTALVYYEDYDLYKRTAVLAYRYDPIENRYIEVIFGDNKKKSLIQEATEHIKGDLETTIKSDIDYIEDMIKDVTDQIKDPSGGIIVTRKDGDGNAIELLITDNKDLDKAKNIWRWNIQGLAHTSGGINGDFDVAMTQDGKIAANFIVTGELNAALIKVGILKSLQGNTWIDMSNGHFQLGDITNDANGFRIKIGNTTLDESLQDLRTDIANTDDKIVSLVTGPGGITASVGELEQKVDNNKTTTDRTLAEIAVTNGEISNKVTNVINTVETNKQSVDTQIGELTTKADGINARVSATNTTVEGNKRDTDSQIAALDIKADGISSRVSSAVTTANGASTTASNAYSLATQTANEVNFKVSKNDIISSINLNAQSATIDSDKINLRGAVTVLSTIAGDLGSVTAGTLSIGDNAFSVNRDGWMRAGNGGFSVPPNADGVFNNFRENGVGDKAARWKYDNANYLYQDSGSFTVYQNGQSMQIRKSSSDGHSFMRLSASGSGGQILKATGHQLQARNYYDNAYSDIAATDFVVSSEREFKKDIKSCKPMLDTVNNTKVFNYKFIEDERGIEKTGFITDSSPASIVSETSDEDKGVSLMDTIGTLWKAVQELSAEVDVLKAEVVELKKGKVQ